MPYFDVFLNANPKAIQPLTKKLTALGYSEKPIAELLGRWDISELNGKEYPNYLWRCARDESGLGRLVSIFLMGRATDQETMHEILGEELTQALLDCQVLAHYKGAWASYAVVFPCLGKFFFTDQWVGTGNQEPGKVYELGTDSYVLARVTPRRNVKRALDLCTGSGIHAVCSSFEAEVSKAVDINPRALHYTTLNAALNGVEVETHLGDLYSVVEGETFDLITANPPFVPSPDPNVLVHRSAGETGEEIPERLVAGLPTHLDKGGMFSMVLDHPVFADETYLERLERWLGEKRGWGIAVLTFSKVSLANYIMGHLQGVERYEETFQNYLESYLRLNIQSMEFANVFILRLESDQPNWQVEQQAKWPNRSIVDQVEQWLDAQKTYFDPEWKADPQWKPRLSSQYKALWRDWDHKGGVLELSDDNWFPPSPLEAEEAKLLWQMKSGERTVGELRAGWNSDEASFDKALRGLGLRRALT